MCLACWRQFAFSENSRLRTFANPPRTVGSWSNPAGSATDSKVPEAAAQSSQKRTFNREEPDSLSSGRTA